MRVLLSGCVSAARIWVTRCGLRDAHAMKGFLMVNLVVSEGTEFASVPVSEDTVLFVDGSDADAPFFWAMGARFAVRAERSGRCPNCEFPIWTVTFSERSFNGSGAEFVVLDTASAEVRDESSAPLLALAFMAAFLESMDTVMALARVLGFDVPGVELATWVGEVGDVLSPTTDDAFARFLSNYDPDAGNESWSVPGPDEYSESFASIVADEI